MVCSVNLAIDLLAEIMLWQNLLKAPVIPNHKLIFVKLRDEQIIILLLFGCFFALFFEFDHGWFLAFFLRRIIGHWVLIESVINAIKPLIVEWSASVLTCHFMLALRHLILIAIILIGLYSSLSVDADAQKVPEDIHQVCLVTANLSYAAIIFCLDHAKGFAFVD